MDSQQRGISPCTAIDIYTAQWTQTLTGIKSQYTETEQSEAVCFKEERELLLEKLQLLQSNYNTAVKDRKQDYTTKLEAHIKTLAEYHFSTTRMEQQVSEAGRSSDLPERPCLRRRRNSRSTGSYTRSSPCAARPRRGLRRHRQTDRIIVTNASSNFDGDIAGCDNADNREAGYVATPIAGTVCCGILGVLEVLKVLYIPVCYCYDKRERSIFGWESGYEDGGPKANSRKFPVWYLDEDLDITPEGHFSIPSESLLCWESVKRLRPLDLCDAASRLVTGFETAVKFSARLKTIQKQALIQKGRLLQQKRHATYGLLRVLLSDARVRQTWHPRTRRIVA
ncbi:hypothetical protein F5B22DRAFT_650341 [Xylaria bambusicola]|uniref:uncharacterized protein n=1 Tax=Xylaria bambusicola TaxID=326684 RepID=UPI00200806C1|nr:uncharacterized protein F5B22DRAFT_650341 [Xylaria bambusicola]KAI0506859.1 hypothetical protein F5B22DRAFT_650341 [Xylaria bambusicola]